MLNKEKNTIAKMLAVLEDLELDHDPDDYGVRSVPPEFMKKVRAVEKTARKILQPKS